MTLFLCIVLIVLSIELDGEAIGGLVDLVNGDVGAAHNGLAISSGSAGDGADGAQLQGAGQAAVRGAALSRLALGRAAGAGTGGTAALVAAGAAIAAAGGQQGKAHRAGQQKCNDLFHICFLLHIMPIRHAAELQSDENMELREHCVLPVLLPKTFVLLLMLTIIEDVLKNVNHSSS